MINPIIFIGAPLRFRKGLYIYPPTVKDVVTNPNFNVFYKVLTYTQNDIKEEIGDKLKENESLPSPFYYLLLRSCYTEGFFSMAEQAFDFFCKAKIECHPQEGVILCKTLTEDNDELEFYLNEENFFEFQNKIREACGDKPLAPPEPYDPEENPVIRRIKEKARERDRMKARQGNENGISLSTCLTAICCMGIGITPLNIGEMSYASIGVIMKMMQDKEKYDIDIRSLLAGADSKKVKPKYWIRNTND